MLVGVASASLILAPVLELLNGAYGIGGATGFPAPQASIMASIPAGIVSGTLPWAHIGIGVALGALIICVTSGSISAGGMMHLFAGTDSEGDSLMGILLAIPVVATSNASALVVTNDPQEWMCWVLLAPHHLFALLHRSLPAIHPRQGRAG
jgi:uncharacterized oligopeptide transporter (OPT) family protein